MSTANPRRRLALHGLVLAGAVLCAWFIGSCKDSSGAAGTSIFVSVNFASPDIQVTQLRFSAKTDHPLFDPVLRPANDSGALLQSGQTLRILIPDSLAGTSVTVGAEGLYLGRVVSQNQSDIRIKKNYEVEIDLLLPSTSTQPNCGPCAGCCSGVTCVTNYSSTNCGNDPLCTRCDPSVADNCSSGDCRCGDNPACDPDAGSDRCVRGQCRCGAQDACRPGQLCNGGQCRCTLTSCPNGCCANNVCVPMASGSAAACGTASKACDPCNPAQNCTGGACSDCPANCPDGCCSGETCYAPGLFNCGTGGRACIVCDPVASDGCTAQGVCSCGGGPDCAPGQHCQNGTCTCDAVSCPNGCCRNNLCESPASNPDAGSTAALSLCGTGGRTCVACDPTRADNCSSSGLCACGSSPPCDVGQKCANGSCFCDPASCPGCCSPDGQGCRAGTVDTECGKGGFTCQTCPSGQTCSDGRCSNCTPVTCAGCCLGSTCAVVMPGPCPTDGGPCVCGRDGVACRSCATLTTDTCNPDGTCGCGAKPPCSGGQRCANGACFCDQVSCPVGCCADGGCVQPSASQCGSGGGSCFACQPQLANNCSSTGNCRCGSAPACILGEQRCLSSGCVCDSVSCSSGCCSSTNRCISPGLNNCGTMGSSCVSCDAIRANQCLNGSCACGSGSPCPAGQHCFNNICRCDSTSCPTGCCNGTACTTPSNSACGIGGQPCSPCRVDAGFQCASGSCQCCLSDGGSCSACDPRSDRCTNGACRCGMGNPCPTGHTCVNGSCS